MHLRTYFAFAAIAVATVAGVSACTSRVESTEDVPVNRVLEVRHGHHEHGHHGPVQIVVEVALEHGELSEQQHVAMVAIRDRYQAERRSKKETKERLRASAIEIVRLGSADCEQFDEAVEEAMGAIEKRSRVTSSALAEVHQQLEPEQRSAVAGVLRDQVAERFERRAKEARGVERIKKVAAYLMLTDGQVAELKKVRKEFFGEKDKLRPSREELESLIDAFEGEAFEVAMESLRADKLEQVRRQVGRLAGHADGALSLLTNEQRELLADLIEFGPEAAGLRER